MYTYQDFIKIPEDKRIENIRSYISSHVSSKEYSTAKVAENYYKRQNETIMNLQKLLYTITGKTIPDTFSTNYKLRSNWFNYFVVQLNQYLLSNGISWREDDTKELFGDQFDMKVKKLSRYALVHGVAYGFWNLDHLEPYSMLEFVPLYDEENGALRAGIRFWQIDATKPLRARLFEEDGYTDLIWRKDEKGSEKGDILNDKRPYIQIIKSTEADGLEIYDGMNYPSFPIVPLFGLDKQSELEGRQELIDCFDIIASGFANSVEEASYIYWAIQNAEGMRDIDLAKFIERMKTIHAAMVKGSNGAVAEPHSIEAPYASREALLNELRTELFYSFKAFDSKQVQSAGAVIAQIDAAYEMLDQKASEYEDNIFEFLDGIMAVTGIDDIPTLTRSKITNRSEEIGNILQAVDLVTEDYATKKILTLLGDGDLADEIIQERDAEDLETISGTEYTDEEGEPDEEENDLQSVLDMLDGLLEGE